MAKTLVLSFVVATATSAIVLPTLSTPGAAHAAISPASGYGAMMWGVDTTSARQAWGVSERDTAMVTHWDGQQWRTVTSPDIGAAVLYDIDMAEPTEGWVVGSEEGPPTQAVIEHWDGSAWTVVPAAPLPQGAASSLHSVSETSPSDVWAVGSYDRGGYLGYDDVGLIEHWDGTSWSVVPLPLSFSPPGVDFSWLGVRAFAADDVWTVGRYGFIAHWEGQHWTVTRDGFEDYFAVDGENPDDVWAVGSLDSASASVAHWNGTTWDTVTVPHGPAGQNALLSLSVDSANDAWAAGNSENYETRVYLPLVEHWNGTRWKVVQTPTPGIAHQLYGVSASASDNVWAVGYYQNRHRGYPSYLLLHWDGSSWTRYRG